MGKKVKKQLKKKKKVNKKENSLKRKGSVQFPTIDWDNFFLPIGDGLKPEATQQQTNQRDAVLKQYISKAFESSKISEKYNFLILYDEYRMLRSDIDKIYSAIANLKEKKPILLMLYSTGGDISSAYLIGKLCREHANGQFAIAVPRQAKSSATLLCCAADELHMGSLSELGPIDPQIERMSALGVTAAIEHIAELVKKHPHASDMFAKYLNYSLKPIHLGYCERVAQSAVQYAERLLEPHKQNLAFSPSVTAKHLVYAYKDHGFVIDKIEAERIFGKKMIKIGTSEYSFVNHIYTTLSSVSRIANYMGYIFYWIGSCETTPDFYKKQKK